METLREIVRVVGEPPSFSFKPRSHVELGRIKGIIDIKQAQKTAGNRFFFLKGLGALLEVGLINLSFKILLDEHFVPVIPPVIVEKCVISGSGWLSRNGMDLFRIDFGHKFLIPTSEVSILGLHIDETLEEKLLPLRYVAFSTCFRREAHGRHKDRGTIMRTHQFDKVEMFSFCRPDQSNSELSYLLSIQEKIMQKLGISYRITKRASKIFGEYEIDEYDIEGWFPGINRYRETHSCTACRDIQSKKLGIRFRKGSTVGFIHTINGTAVAIGRMIAAILENCQNADGTINIPPVLKPFIPNFTNNS